MTTTLDELSRSVEEITSKGGQSVVGVGASGSGVVVGGGQVLTNAHNLRGDELIVTFVDGRRVTATVSAADDEGDLAILAVETGESPAVEWSAGPRRLGEAVVALANPAGRGTRVSVGFVSALDVSFRGPGGRRIAGAIEHTAPLVRGSSGGPLLDTEGRLVGIDTHREGDGFYLAIPADDELRRRVDALSRGEAPRRARLGVALAPPKIARRLRRSVGLPERDGLLVRAVEPGGPADRAGIRQGDLIVSAGGEAIASIDDLASALETGEASSSMELGVVRGVEELRVAVDLSGNHTSDAGSV